MFSWLASFFVFFLHSIPAQVQATAQPHSTGAGTTQSLHADIEGDIPIGTGNSNGDSTP